MHPTLAVYLWLKDSLYDGTGHWRQYKGTGKDKDVPGSVQAMWEILHRRFATESDYSLSPPENEDAFDARVDWLLGHLWLNRKGVQLVGNEQDGSFLLPKDESRTS